MINEDDLHTMVTNERQARELHMVHKKEKGMKKRQLAGLEPATSRSIADPLSA